jgi:hypothetical protein
MREQKMGCGAEKAWKEVKARDQLLRSDADKRKMQLTNNARA